MKKIIVASFLLFAIAGVAMAERSERKMTAKQEQTQKKHGKKHAGKKHHHKKHHHKKTVK